MSTPDEVAYCTRELVQATVDQPDTYRLNKAIDDACRAGARELEGVLHRRFYPVTGVRYPDPRRVSGDTLWMNTMDDEILALDSLVSEGTSLTEGTDFYLERPGAVGPPYTAVRLFRDTAAAWPTDVRDLAGAGRFGGSESTVEAGILASSIAAASTSTMTVTDSSLVGVCDMVLIDSEQVVVVDKAASATGATLTGDVAADEAVRLIPVSSGALVCRGEMILVGAERLFVEDVVGNGLMVQRAQAGSVLSDLPSGATVYAPRLCTIRRGQAGTTAAAHATASTLYRNVAPSLVVEANLALAINYVEQGKSAYARTAGAGDHRRSTGGTGVAAAIAAAVDAADRAYGRHGRIGVA